MDLLSLNESPGAYPASYYAATAPLLEALPPLAGEIDADVCVIGAGYTGLSAALHLAQRGMKVVVVEGQRVGWGASGRNGGQLASGWRHGQDKLEAMLGIEHARLLWRLSEDAKNLVKSLIATQDIDAELKSGVLYADHKARFTEGTRAEVEHLRKAYGYEAMRFVPREEMSQLLGTKSYFSGSLDMDAGHLHPLKFVLGLARAAQKAGAVVHEQSRAISIDECDPAIVRTEGGSVRARFVVVACNGYLGLLERQVAAHVMPINSYIIATEPLGGGAKEIIRDDIAVADSRFVVNYFRLSADRRLLFGGRESYGYRFPTDIETRVRQRMLGIFPQLREAKITHAWGGTLAITMNRLPYVRRLAPNILSASGYSGHGVALSTLAGQLCAEAIAGQAERFDVLARIPVPAFPGGSSLRRPLLVLAMLWYALRDRL